MTSTKPKILVLDIETAPAELYGWGMYNQNFGVSQIKKPPYILCVGAQWLGQPNVQMYTRWDMGEEAMLRKVQELITEADALVGKNSERFDLPWLKGEFVRLGIPNPPPTTHIDLEKTCRKEFRFLSGKLEFIAPFLGVGDKMDTGGFELWAEVMKNNPVAQRKMVRYCARDVRITGKLYKKIRSFIPNHPHMGFTPKRECGCCGSSKVHVSKWRRTKAMRIQQLHCQSCGSYFDGIKQKVE